MQYVALQNIKVAEPLLRFVEDRVLPGLDLGIDEFKKIVDDILSTHIPRNVELLQKRDALQARIDDWHANNRYDPENLQDYMAFLKDIGYLLEEGDAFTVDVHNVDREIAEVAAPQLVVPINNARFSINAANARWGSLYDALYGTDMIANDGDTAITRDYNPKRGDVVFRFCGQWLDEVLPLHNASHADVTAYEVADGEHGRFLRCTLKDNSTTTLVEPSQFKGSSDQHGEALLFMHNDLHFELQIDRDHTIGGMHPAGLRDIVVEAAVTTIQDCEDSVAAVDVEDKIGVYSNWLQLIQGSIEADMEKGGKRLLRRLNPDRHYSDAHGQDFSLSGRSLMLIRNTGIHMKTGLALTADGNPAPEGLMDALVTVLISMHDLKADNPIHNSNTGSIYIVKPKMHGPEEVAFTCQVFADIEKAYGLAENTVKIGIMDEERRTTINLKECIRQARNRVIFINTGFLDRTGDEIHTSMEAGPMLTKGRIKGASWMAAYEDWNVDIGLECGLHHVAQIGKGMWAVPDRMREMYDSKGVHPEAGASCAWVPSPTAATLHSLHYHQVNVRQRQQELQDRPRASLDHLLTIPLIPPNFSLPSKTVQEELDNNAQGILGYVSRWIQLGIGCSKVPDVNDIGLMEDRATLRISSQHITNWLRHDLVSREQVEYTFKRMAGVVDGQNAGTPGYIDMAPSFTDLAFECAMDLVLKGTESPNGYTEDLLQSYRIKAKG
jgi:malate synthase